MKSKIVKLKTIIQPLGLFSGYSFRGKVNYNVEGDLRVVQLKDFENNYSSIGEDCVLVDGAKIKEKYWLKDGDILFISKGSNNYSIVYNKTEDIPTIASSSLFVIRVNKEKANPNYVSWYINQDKVQLHLKQNLMGTYVPNINKPTVEEIPVALPELNVQEKIAAIAQLNNIEQKLFNQIKELRSSLIQQQLLNTI